MAYFNKFRGTKGFISTWERVIRFRYMITEEAKKRVKILAFWEKYGTQATESATTDFMQKFKQVAPLELLAVQTDNGSEFEKHFHLYLEKDGIIHFNTYPRSPKMNSEIERFNRTLSDAFIKQHRYLLAYDIDQFNEKLIDWLLWYNTRRPHWSLGLISPLRYICNQLSEEKSQMCWTSTKT